MVALVGPHMRAAWRAEARARRAESRGGVPDRRPGVFEHSRHSVWLLWDLNSVWRLQHLSTPSTDKCKWQNDREGLHSFAKHHAQRKILKYKLCRVVDPSGKVGPPTGSQLWGTCIWSVIRVSGSQTRVAGSEIRWDPLNFTPGLGVLLLQYLLV